MSTAELIGMEYNKGFVTTERRAPRPRMTVAEREVFEKRIRDLTMALELRDAYQTQTQGMLDASKKRTKELYDEMVGWQDTSMMFYRGQKFYQDIVINCGILLGEETFTSDDGVVQDNVLALKVEDVLFKRLNRPPGGLLGKIRTMLFGD